ncbi:McrB family protein [Zunongwangia pacifica]|uniref:AAA family ATPase n=1 Tax=Zunongwangia pacifica TaxID=2911062 RepID=A0A9X2CNU1_9FLAO|nr:AAA family ATPase [Zunongwangia pacifica]MCL6220920.1 AAA family ATPase [Zunongwangia pacifica]
MEQSNQKLEFDKDYFDLSKIEDYGEKVDKTYVADSDEARWFYDTREKLYYLVKLLSERLNEDFQIVYREKPNGQRGPSLIGFKNYVLVGFAPKEFNIGDDLFMKIEFSNIKSKPVFRINIDLNFRKESSPFQKRRDEIFTNHNTEWEINSEFPDNWDDLLEVLGKPISDLKSVYKSYIKTRQSNAMKLDIIELPLNQILYGPPGTGKTFRLQDKYFDKFTVSESKLSREQYIENAVADLTWWQTFAVALYDLGLSSSTEILNHEIVKAKERQSSAKSIKPILWSRLQAHTVLDCPNVNVKTRSEPQLFFKNDTSKWRVDDALLTEAYPEALEILDKIKNFQPEEGKIIKNYEFVTFHQSFSYEDFVEGIKPKMEEQSTDLEYEIQDGIFKRIALKAKADPENDYAIFIDEINRGNVSAIFGELITLIEKDKRLGEPNALEVKLPYSRTSFGVPANLYIFGTMNTADRSVEALDTALRRRFAFEEVMPKPELFEELEVAGISIQELLKKINQRIEALLDRDHTIGHSYFYKVKEAEHKEAALKSVFKDNIIPLLQEYFYGDYSSIGLVLGEGFVRVEQPENSTRFAKVEGLGTEIEVAPRVELLPINEAFDINEALQNLMQDA